MKQQIKDNWHYIIAFILFLMGMFFAILAYTSEVKMDYIEEIRYADEKSCGVYEGAVGCWWVYLTINGQKCDVYHTFYSKEEAEEFLQSYLKIINKKD